MTSDHQHHEEEEDGTTFFVGIVAAAVICSHRVYFACPPFHGFFSCCNDLNF